jgi:hypothetical protein
MVGCFGTCGEVTQKAAHLMATGKGRMTPFKGMSLDLTSSHLQEHHRLVTKPLTHMPLGEHLSSYTF